MSRSRRLIAMRLCTPVVVFLTAGVAYAKPPANETPKPSETGPTPPNIQAAMRSPTTQPIKINQHGLADTPKPTVELKPGEAPQIEFDTPIYDFGKIKTGKDVEHDFWFHNPGNGPLEILQVKPS